MKINFDQLGELAKQQPQFTRLFVGLSQIDKFIKQVATDTVENQASNPDTYYIKTELSDDSYILSLFNADQQKGIDAQWNIAYLLDLCKTKTIEYHIQSTICRMIKDFN